MLLRLKRFFIYFTFTIIITSRNILINAEIEVADCLRTTNSALMCFKNVIDNIQLNNNVSNNNMELLYETFSDRLYKTINDSNYVLTIDDVNFPIELSNTTSVSERKMKMNVGKILPFLIAPAFFLAGIMPWILPPLKMAVSFVGLINNIVFVQALYSLVRNYVFNAVKDEHIIYLNHGYKNKVHHPV